MPERTSLIEKAVAMDSTLAHPMIKQGGASHGCGGTQVAQSAVVPPSLKKKGSIPRMRGNSSREREANDSSPSLEKRGPWMQTASGRKYYFLTPSPLDIYWPDVAAHLGKINRYNGATVLFFSVAQHCSEMARLLPPALKPYALLHDAHEYVIGDWTTPLQCALQELDPAAKAAVDELKNRADYALFGAANIPYPMPPDIRDAIKKADLAILAAEKDQLLVPLEWDFNLPRPAPIKIIPKSWDRAADQYLADLEQWVFPHILAQKSHHPKP